ncbi:hypothetical protein CVD25_21185 [Bacillus canaveralius]|uniref:Coupling factor for flagellin transcription and translation n=1 Tax=Bacillus canaveralius TaxID=1403243 RepID=A0A2N5GP10_9BACI|nr:hypothetical protein [Bacillus canaveralius]PLR84238.1 hypothetical protein CU635_07985 [Bacillus canaveralius]PLR89416.1 hypothetical protein CVD25_21185 [Bacillus canaveralius]
MTTFFLFISFILNVVAILAIILLYLRQNRFFEAEKNQARLISEMEEIISAYLLEMKEENERFIEKFSLKSETGRFIVQDKGLSSVLDEGTGNKEFNPDADNAIALADSSLRIGKATAYHAVKAYKQNSGNQVDETGIDTPAPADPNDQSLNGAKQEETQLNQIFRLREQGLNPAEIAKKLHKGKTEIELLLKFNQKQQE